MVKINVVNMLDESLLLDVEIPVYSFRAICTSELCCLDKAKVIRSTTGPGVIKNVSKTKTWCPDCEEALFWEKTRVR